MYVCMYVCMYVPDYELIIVQMFVRIEISSFQKCIYFILAELQSDATVCMYVFVYVCIHVCMYVCM
jgi:hypothetical protein